MKPAILFLPPLRDHHSCVEMQQLLHEFVCGEGGGDHGDRSDVVDAHAPVQTLHYAVLTVYEGQSLHHASAEMMESSVGDKRDCQMY